MKFDKYQQPRAIRREAISRAGTFRGGKLVPVAMHALRESEGGVVTQNVNLRLDPIPGRVISQIMGYAVTVFVPALAMDAMQNDGDEFPGNEEIYREKLLSFETVFPMEEEHEISKRIGIEPISIGGVKQVSSVVRLGHNCAVNFLRRRRYLKAAQLDKNSTAITPALLSETILQRMNGVLNPEDRVNGTVTMEFPDQKLKVEGISYLNEGSHRFFPGGEGKETGGDAVDYEAAYGHLGLRVRTKVGQKAPEIWAQMYDVGSKGLRLQDFYTAERVDKMTREMREIVDENPEYGESIIARYAAGLAVETGRQPFVLYERELPFGKIADRAHDGPNLGQQNTETALNFSLTVPVPRTELGGCLITFVSVKPDETLANQPHPILSQPWAASNHIADELVEDPVPVRVRDLNADCDPNDETNVAFYARNHWSKELYTSWGFNRQIDLTTVEAETSVWQLQVPLSATPDNVIYPEEINHDIFADRQAEVVRYVVEATARIATPTVFGPAPIEELDAIESFDIFEDGEEE